LLQLSAKSVDAILAALEKVIANLGEMVFVY